MLILGIETSCDETAASVVKSDKNGIFVLSNVVSSQIEIHQKYNGVVPEIAAREHVLNILPVINEALEKAGINKNQASKKLNVLAVAAGPGLITSLLVGVETAKTLSYSWGLPLAAINHIDGHISANFIVPDGQVKIKTTYPAIILTVSGGHTMLVLMDKNGKMKTVGQTRDDAAGEAFDKAAKLLNLGYPGGPIVSKTAELFDGVEKDGGLKIDLPRPMINEPNFDFSFSGLKTALLYKIKKDDHWQERIPEYCYEFQKAVVDVLIAKTKKAAKKFGAKTIMLCGGVSANSALREAFIGLAKDNDWQCRIPELKYTTDNAAMIAAAGAMKAKKKDFTSWKKIKADCNFNF
jgi:N6-L-threonylcarbamoyladenine synthase